MRHIVLVALLGVALGLVSAGLALAQIVIDGREAIDFDRPEAWAMKYFASVSIPSSFGSPEPSTAGEFDVALEYVQIPSLSEDERRVGFGGTKLEDLNKVPSVIRPVARVGLGKKFTLSASYIPPVERNGAEASIFALALGRPIHEGRSWRLGLRLHAQTGTVEGDFTCSEQTVAAGNDPEGNPFACEAVSEEEYDLQSIGLELSAAWELGEEARWEPLVAVSYNRMDLEFQVNARYASLIDRTRLVTDGQTLYALAGIGYRRISREVFGTLQ